MVVCDVDHTRVWFMDAHRRTPALEHLSIHSHTYTHSHLGVHEVLLDGGLHLGDQQRGHLGHVGQLCVYVCV